MSNWKKTSEELPEEKKDLIFKDYVGCNSFGYYDKDTDNFWDYDGSGGLNSFSVASWCYVPDYDL